MSAAKSKDYSYCEETVSPHIMSSSLAERFSLDSLEAGEIMDEY